jgi:hypothetical protein
MKKPGTMQKYPETVRAMMGRESRTFLKTLTRNIDSALPLGMPVLSVSVALVGLLAGMILAGYRWKKARRR